MAQFPEYADLADDPARQRWTIGHMLSMTLGTAWDELSIPYTNPANSEIAMENAPDRYRFILGRPVVGEPGARWTYNGGATALLGGLIAKGTGRALLDFAQEALFAPLGIAAFEWARGFDGAPSAASGLRLRPRDLARIGRMLAQDGQWDGRTVVPAAWLEACFQARVSIDENRRYGYHWYLGDPRLAGGPIRPDRLVAAVGNGGQRLFRVRGTDLVIVTTFGNYNQPDQWKPPMALLREVILPALR